MGLRFVRVFPFLIAVSFLWGCPTRQALREPADSYGVAKLDSSAEDLARAKADFERDPKAPEAGRAAFILARHALRQARWGDLEIITARLGKESPNSIWLAPLLHLRLLGTGQAEGALRFLQRIDESLRRWPQDRDFNLAVRELTPAALSAASQSDLETFIASAPDGPLAPDVLFSLGSLLAKQGADEEASRALRSLVAKFPSAPGVPRAFEILRELSRKVPVNSRVIGVLLPETGPNAPLGTELAQGVRLALEDFKDGATPFEFAFADTAEDPALAVRSLQSLVAERQVIALIGPLFSKTALACAAEANALGVVLMTPAALSSRLTATGPYVFRAAITPEQQAGAIARFAVKERGFTRFATMAPDNAYGRSMAAAFTAALAAAGGTVLAESRYPPASSDFADPIVGIGGSDVSGFKEQDEEFRRAGQAELEVFLQKFFSAAGDLAPAPPVSSTIPVAPPSPSAPPPSSKVACFTLTPEPFTSELAQRLRAAALSKKTITVLQPESGTQYSVHITRAEVESQGATSSPEELALSELLGQASADRDAPLAVLISVHDAGTTVQAQTLECVLAMYDTRTGRQMARHDFKARRPLQTVGNRYGVEAVYLPVPGTHLLHICPQLVYHSLSVTLFGSDTWDDEALHKRPEAVTLDAYFTTPFWPDLADSRTADFTRRYKERYAAPPDAIAAAAYDAARLTMNAILRSDGTREGLRQALSETGSFDSVAGPATLSPQRDLVREPVILRIAGGAFVPAR